jgi:hypothetical protein
VDVLDWSEVSQRKQVLLDAGMYERKCTDREICKLYVELRAEGPVEQRLVKLVEVYYARSDLFPDMYLLCNLTNITK